LSQQFISKFQHLKTRGRGEWCGASGGGRSFSGDDKGEASGGGDAVWSSGERERVVEAFALFLCFLPFLIFFFKEKISYKPSPGKCPGWPGPRSAYVHKAHARKDAGTSTHEYFQDI
jgi:hypothetical protein